ncbi:Hypothetical predicted protein [Octopus vulgaris]|uniref:Uncharacterized protein n=1 Tax=Octopus vulgaris TaxID=6645 RepID=A0AA36AJN1_OCTVU|nr:Hypothetical predicted protein [Octopus vulgaris]
MNTTSSYYTQRLEYLQYPVNILNLPQIKISLFASMGDERKPNQLFYGELTGEKRHRRKPKRETTMKPFGMNPEDIAPLASD